MNSFRFHFLGTSQISWVLLLSYNATYLHLHKFSPFRFHFSACPSKLITKAHCYIPSGGADAAAVGAVAFVGDVLKRYIEREAARELQRCAQVEREPRG